MKNGYLKIDVGTATPERLVGRLLERAVSNVRSARSDGPLEGGDRTQTLARALDIVCELRGALDLEQGGEIAANLDAIYEFVNHRLLAASIESGDQPLDDALKPLEIIADAWNQMCDRSDVGAA